MQPMKKQLFIFTSVITFCVDVSYLHPLLDSGSFPLDYDYLEGVKSDFSRDKDDLQKTQDRDLFSEGEMNVVQKNDHMKGDMLPSDEQEECYRQQNIESPPTFHEYHRSGESSKKEIDSVLAPISYRGNCKTDQQNSVELSPSDHSLPLLSDHEKDDLTRKSSENEHKENHESNLLHRDSHLKNAYEFEKKVPRSYFSEKSSRPQVIQGERSVSMINRKVYKPLQFEATFPVYDEDIEFRPDPLHGLLDDKYWKNQQDKGDVIRNYIDLAINNMVPHGEDIVKRNIASGKSRFKEHGERCPCNQIVACKDCKKGKQEEIQEEKSKSNISRSNANKEKASSSFSNGKEFIEGNNEYFSRKLMSLDHNNDEKETDSNFPTYINSYITRKLLSLDDEVEHDSYDEEVEADRLIQENNVDRIKNDGMKSFEYNGKNEYNDYDSSRERGKDDYGQFNERYINIEDSFPSVSEFRRNTEITTEKYKYENYLNFIDNANNENTTHPGMPILEMSSLYPSLYVPNRLGNMMQKTRHEKQKKAKPDPNLKFEAMENETFQNFMLQPSLSYNDKNEEKIRQDNVENYKFQKGRRSPVGSWPDIIFTPLGSTFQQPSDEIKVNSPLPTIAINITTSNRKSTIGTTSYPIPITQSPHPTDKKHRKKHLKLSDEENEDAEIANDIVESVLIESQKDALLGHNLGLYRRKVSLTNVKYSKAIPETEKIVGLVLDCIMNQMKDQLAKLSCIMLDAELLEFLKWLVLTGEPYRDYSRKDFTIGSPIVKTKDVSSDTELEDTVNVDIESTSISSTRT